ncbi:hypothetical protein [Paraburkholderia sp. MM5482-R1]|uniref:hypothetical protein n=1 Tax=unclassified Paraburkholderia TaxID=2615204 RepID=UPI003D25BECF
MSDPKEVLQQVQAPVPSAQPWHANRDNVAAPLAAISRTAREGGRSPGFALGPVNEAREARAARVHIGTVEVRVTSATAPALPQSVDSSPAAESHDSLSHARKRMASADMQPLARGLAWRYGLVQG